MKQATAVATKTKTKEPVNERARQTLSEYIEERYDEFSRSQKDVAQYIIDHLDEAAFQTAEQLAKRANTSSSTVVRFSQALGFEGYPELQQSAREEYRRHPQSSVERGDSPLFSLDQNEYESVIAADHVNIEDTAGKISRKDVDAAIEAISQAESIVIAGTDQMAFFGSYMRHLLTLLDIRADIVASPSQDALNKLSRVGEGTLLIGLSAGRPHPLVLRAMKLARQRKCRSISITDATLSEVAKLAQIKLYYSSSNPAFVRSHTALLSLIQAISNGVYARDADRFDHRIKAFRLK